MSLRGGGRGLRTLAQTDEGAFFTENLLPWRIEDVRRFNYAMTPLPIVRSDQLLNDAEALKNRARIAAPPGVAPPPQ